MSQDAFRPVSCLPSPGDCLTIMGPHLAYHINLGVQLSHIDCQEMYYHLEVTV